MYIVNQCEKTSHYLENISTICLYQFFLSLFYIYIYIYNIYIYIY